MTDILKVDFGGGEAEKYPDFKKCDLLDNPDIEYPGINFDIDNLPMEDNSVDEAVCSHTLEHVRNTRHFLNELHRVLKPESKIRFIVPYGTWEGSFKPVHVNQITECWFDFLRKENSERVYGYKRWIIHEFVFKTTKEGQKYEMEAVMSKLTEK